jgi:hypothetical protein
MRSDMEVTGAIFGIALVAIVYFGSMPYWLGV